MTEPIGSFFLQQLDALLVDSIKLGNDNSATIKQLVASCRNESLRHLSEATETKRAELEKARQSELDTFENRFKSKDPEDKERLISLYLCAIDDPISYNLSDDELKQFEMLCEEAQQNFLIDLEWVPWVDIDSTMETKSSPNKRPVVLCSLRDGGWLKIGEEIPFQRSEKGKWEIVVRH